MLKKGWVMLFTLIFVFVFNAGFTNNIPDDQIASVTTVDNLTGTEDQIEAKKLYDKIYEETPFVIDADKEIKMYEPKSTEEAQEIYDKVYSETPFIKNASEGKGDEISPDAVNLPYYFNFDFDKTMTSISIYNNDDGGTIRITANADWVQKPNEYEGSPYNYYDVTLYADNKNKGTYRFDIGAWQHADWYNIPSGNFYFVMTKHVYTWDDSPYPGYDGNISGSGEVLNP
jgi:hypothetical protein